MKKLSILAIMGMMILSLTACGKKDNGMTNSGTNSGSKAGSNDSNYNSSIIDGDGINDGTNSGNQENGQHYFNGTITKIEGNEITVKPTGNEKVNADEKITGADEIKIDTSMVSTDSMPELKEGDKIRVVFNKDNFLEDLFKIDKVFAVYKIDDNGNVVSGK